MAIVLYQIPASGPCRAIMMTAQYLGIKLDKKHVDLFTGEQMKPEFLQMNPQHCVPTIDDNGFYLWESRAILTYLVNKYAPDSPLYPRNPKQRAIVDRMLYFDIGSIFKAQVDIVRPMIFEKKQPDPAKEEELKKVLSLFEVFLGKTTYAASNHMTLADYSIIGNLSFLEIVLEYDFTPYPKISAWMQKMKTEVPNYQEINDIPLKEFKEFLKTRI